MKDDSKGYVSGIIEEQLKQLDLKDIENLMPQTANNQPIVDISISGMIQNAIDGKPMLDMKHLLDTIIGLFTHEIYNNIQFAMEILAICIIIGLLKNMSNSFGDSAVSKVAVLISSCTAMGICIKSFIEIYRLCEETINGIMNIMQSILPAMVALMISSGQISSGAILNPAILAALSLFVSIIKSVILPGIFIASVFFLINGMVEKDYIKRLAKFIRTASMYAMGLCITLFSGTVALQGIVTTSIDTLFLKGIKFSTDKFIPVVGGFMADSLGLILSCAGLLKSAVGVFGVILVIVTMLIPILKIVVISLIYKATSILIEPIGEAKISDSIHEIGTSTMTLAMLLALAMVLFLVFITILINVGRI